MPPSPPQTASDAIRDLLLTKEETDNALTRCKFAIQSLDIYLQSITAEHVTSANLATTLEDYDKAAAVLDRKQSKLIRELRDLDDRIAEERGKLVNPNQNEQLRVKVSVGVFAHAPGEVELNLIYGEFASRFTAIDG